MTTTELNDDVDINVTLPIAQWNTILDWIAHSPFDEARATLDSLNKQIENATATDTFTAALPIRTFNMLIFALGQAPYYMMAEPIQQIYNQGQSEITRLKEQAAAAAAQILNRDPVEKSDDNPDNDAIEAQPAARKRTRRTKKSE